MKVPKIPTKKKQLRVLAIHLKSAIVATRALRREPGEWTLGVAHAAIKPFEQPFPAFVESLDPLLAKLPGAVQELFDAEEQHSSKPDSGSVSRYVNASDELFTLLVSTLAETRSLRKIKSGQKTERRT